MKCNNCLLTYLIFMTLLLMSEAGRGWQPPPQSSGSRPVATAGNNAGGTNSGRVSPGGTNFGRTPAWGGPRPSGTPVRPGPQPSGTSAWNRPQTPVSPAGNRPQTPGSSAGNRPQTPGSSVWNRPQTPGSSVWNRPQTPVSPAGNRPQTPGSSVWNRLQTPGSSVWNRPQAPVSPAGNRPQTPVSPAWNRPQTPGSSSGNRPQAPVSPAGNRPQTPGSPAWNRPQTPGSSTWARPQTSGISAWNGPQHGGSPVRPSGTQMWPRPPQSGTSAWGGQDSTAIQSSGQLPSSVSSNQRPPSPTNNNFPSLAQPARTFAEAEHQRQQELLKSPSTSSMSSVGSASQYPPGSRRPSLASLGSFSSGYGSSGSLNSRFGVNQPSLVGRQTSLVNDNSCVDNSSPAESCFDYFTLSVTWSPGDAYRQLKKGHHIREGKIHPKWVIHGLWPSMFSNLVPPPTCSRTDIYFRADRFITNKLVGVLDNNWYTILDKGYSDNKRFWEHEFKKHGSCASRSKVIRDDVNYFAITIELYSQLQLDMTLFNGGYKHGGITTLREIIRIIENRVQAKVEVHFTRNPRSSENYLTEVYICYDTVLNVINCPNSYRPDYVLDADVKYLTELPKK